MTSPGPATDSDPPGSPHLETIPVILATTMLTHKWDVSLPIDVPVQTLISKFVSNATLPFREQDELGNTIPYRLFWQEQNRYLRESETLRQAGVQPGNTLVMTHEARAGRARR